MSDAIAFREPGVNYAWGYGRQSSKDQIDEGLPRQGARIRLSYAAHIEPLGIKWGGFIPDDSPTSARTNPFMLRHAGRLLFDLMQPGDYFIIDKIDRLWRSNEDFVDVSRQLKSRGITLHICNLMGASVTLGTPMGDFMLNLMVIIAQLESDQTSDRTRAAYRSRRSDGKFSVSTIPMGCKKLGSIERHSGRIVADTRKLIWDQDYRKFMAEIVRLADIERLSASQISKTMNRHFREFMGDTFWKKVIVQRNWSDLTIAGLYWRERQYQVLPVFDPNRLKFEVLHPANSVARGRMYRDIGPKEPDTPNPYPFLDGRKIPRDAEELYQLGESP